MIYYYIKHDEFNIGLGYNSLNNLPENGGEITQELYEELAIPLNNGKRIYLDDGIPKLRDKFTKWDEKKQSWIPDQNAIIEDERLTLKYQAQQALNETTEYESESFKAICTEEENEANLAYRIELRKILKDMYNGTKLPINPNKKE